MFNYWKELLTSLDEGIDVLIRNSWNSDRSKMDLQMEAVLCILWHFLDLLNTVFFSVLDVLFACWWKWPLFFLIVQLHCTVLVSCKILRLVEQVWGMSKNIIFWALFWGLKSSLCTIQNTHVLISEGRGCGWTIIKGGLLIITWLPLFLGVADGVGGWRDYGVDPSQFSGTLMKTCERLVKEGRFVPSNPVGVLTTSYYELLQNKVPLLGE